MVKLYKKVEGQLQYGETWEDDDQKSIVHWGVVGDRGQNLMIGEEQHTDYAQIIENVIQEKLDDGFVELDDDQLIYLEIVYTIEGFGTEEDLDKRHRLEDRLNETLGWTGLGHVDGGVLEADQWK